MKINIIERPAGFRAAIIGVRNSRQSHENSDSYNADGEFFLGERDSKLLQDVKNLGDDHFQAARVIKVWVSITAPRYYWQEFSNYNQGVDRAGSESTIYDKLGAYTKKDFNFPISENQLRELNSYRDKKSLKESLPEGFLQTRSFCINYQALRHMYNSRKRHPLVEWRTFCAWVESLPYFEELIK